MVAYMVDACNKDIQGRCSTAQWNLNLLQEEISYELNSKSNSSQSHGYVKAAGHQGSMGCHQSFQAAGQQISRGERGQQHNRAVAQQRVKATGPKDSQMFKVACVPSCLIQIWLPARNLKLMQR